MKIKLYTTHCPKCRVLEEKLSKTKLEWEVCEDMDELRRTYPEIDSVPRLLVERDGNSILMDFAGAAAFLNAVLKNKNC
jgi:hypothetical protein